MVGVAVPVEFKEGKPVLIMAGDLETLNEYLGTSGDVGQMQAKEAMIMVGNDVEIPSMPDFVGFASRLNKREYGKEITAEEIAEAKEKGLVVVFGYSDDCTEFRGAIYDEVGLGEIWITPKGKILTQGGLDALKSLQKDGVATETIPKGILAIFDTHHHYETTIPHARFKVMEDGELYCVGIVFQLSDLKN